MAVPTVPTGRANSNYFYGHFVITSYLQVPMDRSKVVVAGRPSYNEIISS